ncbi:MAG: ABC transporter ATP-binding protein [bacterium]
MPPSILELENVGRSFTEEAVHEVLRDVSLEVKPGEFVCLLGPSGCGKTVLLYLVAGFLSPTSGRIMFDGRPVVSPATDRMMVFQEYVLFPWLTVRGNVMFGLESSGLPHRNRERLADKYLDLVGLTKFSSWPVHVLSGGMKQRVAIARALVSDPQILLMDEPFSALDSQNRKYMRRSLERIWQQTGKTVLFVTHSVNEAIYLADTIHLISSSPGRVKKTYRIDLPRPRDPHAPEFVRLSRDVEDALSEEFLKRLEQEAAGDLASERILLGRN